MYRLFPSLTLIAYCAFGWFFTYLDDQYDQPILYWAGMATYVVGIIVFVVTSFIMYKQHYQEKMEARKVRYYRRLTIVLSNPQVSQTQKEVF